MRNLSILLALLIVFITCSTGEDKQLKIFNDVVFELHNNEKVLNLSPLLNDEYQRYVGSKNIQIPLFRCVKNPQYTLYIGIPYNASIDQFAQSAQLDQVKDFQQYSDTTFVYRSYQSDSLYISEYAAKVAGNLLYTLAIAQTKVASDSLFNHTSLSQRIVNTAH